MWHQRTRQFLFVFVKFKQLNVSEWIFLAFSKKLVTFRLSPSMRLENISFIQKQKVNQHFLVLWFPIHVKNQNKSASYSPLFCTEESCCSWRLMTSWADIWLQLHRRFSSSIFTKFHSVRSLTEEKWSDLKTHPLCRLIFWCCSDKKKKIHLQTRYAQFVIICVKIHFPSPTVPRIPFHIT